MWTIHKWNPIGYPASKLTVTDISTKEHSLENASTFPWYSHFSLLEWLVWVAAGSTKDISCPQPVNRKSNTKCTLKDTFALVRLSYIERFCSQWTMKTRWDLNKSSLPSCNRSRNSNYSGSSLDKCMANLHIELHWICPSVVGPQPFWPTLTELAVA